jgi:hypothetical protein
MISKSILIRGIGFSFFIFAFTSHLLQFFCQKSKSARAGGSKHVDFPTSASWRGNSFAFPLPTFVSLPASPDGSGEVGGVNVIRSKSSEVSPFLAVAGANAVPPIEVCPYHGTGDAIRIKNKISML